MSGSAAPSRLKLLVIDDEEDLLRVFHRALDREHELVSVMSAEEGLERIDRGEHFDLILCDQLLPLMTGATLLGILRERWPSLAQRFVLLTSDAMLARSLGCAVIPKPFSLAEIRRALAQHAQH